MAQSEKVLIVDDEPPIRRLLTRWVRGWGYAARDVGSAVEALEVMATDPAEIVLCDISMPEHDGLWLTEQLRAQYPHAAVVMSTGQDDARIVRTSRALGAFAYVTKPFDPDLVHQALDHASGRLRFRPSAEAK